MSKHNNNNNNLPSTSAPSLEGGPSNGRHLDRPGRGTNSRLSSPNAAGQKPKKGKKRSNKHSKTTVVKAPKKPPSDSEPDEESDELSDGPESDRVDAHILLGQPDMEDMSDFGVPPGEESEHDDEQGSAHDEDEPGSTSVNAIPPGDNHPGHQPPTGDQLFRDASHHRVDVRFPIALREFVDPWRRTFLMFHMRNLVEGGLPKFVLNEPDFEKSPNLIAEFTNTLLLRAESAEPAPEGSTNWFHMALSVLHEALVGPADLQTHFHSEADLLRDEIIRSTKRITSIYELGGVHCTSSIHPPFLQLVSPADYAVLLAAMGIQNVNRLPWTNHDPEAPDGSPSVNWDRMVEAATVTPHQIPYLWWAQLTRDVTWRLNEVWAGEISEFSVGMQHETRAVGAPFPTDATALATRLSLFPPGTSVARTQDLIQWHLAVSDIWVLRAPVATQALGSRNILRLHLAWGGAEFPPVTATTAQLAERLSTLPLCEHSRRHGMVRNIADMYYVMMLPYPFLASWTERSANFPLLYDLAKFREADRAEQRQYALGLWYHSQSSQEDYFELMPDTWIFRLILHGGGVRMPNAAGAMPFDPTRVLIAPSHGFTAALKGPAAPSILFLDEKDWFEDPLLFQRYLHSRHVTQELRWARVTALAVRPHVETHNTPVNIEFFPERRHRAILRHVPHIEDELERVRDFNRKITTGLARAAASTQIVVRRFGTPTDNTPGSTALDPRTQEPSRNKRQRSSPTAETVDLTETDSGSPAPSRHRPSTSTTEFHAPPPARSGARNVGVFNIALRTPPAIRSPLESNILHWLHSLDSLEWEDTHSLFAQRFTQTVDRVHYVVITRPGDRVILVRHVSDTPHEFPAELSWDYVQRCQMAIYTVTRSDAAVSSLTFEDHFFVPTPELGFDWPPTMPALPVASPYYMWRLRLPADPVTTSRTAPYTPVVPNSPARLLPPPGLPPPASGGPFGQSSTNVFACNTDRGSFPVRNLARESLPTMGSPVPATSSGRVSLEKALKHTGRFPADESLGESTRSRKKNKKHRKSHRKRNHRSHSRSGSSSGSQSSSSSSSGSDSEDGAKSSHRSYTDSAGYVVHDKKGATQERVTATTAMRTLINDSARFARILAKKGNFLSLYTVDNLFEGCRELWLASLMLQQVGSSLNTPLLLPSVSFRAWYAMRLLNKILAEKIAFFGFEALTISDDTLIRLAHFLTLDRIRQLPNNELLTWQDFCLALQGLEDTYGFFYGEPFRAVFHGIHQYVVQTQLGAMLSLAFLEYWVLNLLARIHTAARDPTQPYTAVDKVNYPEPFIPYNFSAEQWTLLIKNEFFASVGELTLPNSLLFERSFSTAWGTLITFPHPSGKFGEHARGAVTSSNIKPATASAAPATSSQLTPTKAKKANTGKKETESTPQPHRQQSTPGATQDRVPIQDRICCRGLCHEWSIPLRATLKFPAGVPSQCTSECKYKHLHQLPAGTTKASVVKQVKRTVEKILHPDQVRTFLEHVQSDARLV